MRQWPKSVRTGLMLVAIAVAAAGLAYVSVQTVGFLQVSERSVSDALIAHLLPNEPQDPDVVIVGIDQDLLARFPYREPFDRAYLSHILQVLQAAKARAIGVDILLDQPTEPDKDKLLKDTIASLTVPVVFSYTDWPHEVTDEQLAYLNDFLPVDKRVWANEPEDPVDGEVRQIYPGHLMKDGTYRPGFARGVAALAGVVLKDADRNRWIDIAWHGHPLDDPDEQPFFIVNAAWIDSYPVETFAGKIVLVGGIDSLRDRHRTPLASGQSEQHASLPGIVIHAHAVSQLLHGHQILKLRGAAEFAVVLLLSLIGMGFGMTDQSVLRHVALGLVTLGIWGAVVFGVYYYRGYSVPMVAPTIGFVLALGGANAFSGREAKRQRAFINGAFARYLNPNLVKQLAEDPSKLQLGGEMREMTLMFCDIRGFTTISEQFDAHGLTRFINRFLTPMTDLILSENGTIDKYMGDAIMAFWNAPLDDPAHAEHACRAALGMRETLKQLNATWKAEAEAAGNRHIPVNIGIGVNTGLCCVGNVGSDQRFDYSVLGDDVNLASRLEGQSKTYHLDIVIGARTAAAVPMLAILELDSIMVKGKTEPVHIFSLVGDETVLADPAFARQKIAHDAMLVAFRSQNWGEARRQIALCRGESLPVMLGFYDVYEDRIAQYEITPPPSDWDGVYVALSK